MRTCTWAARAIAVAALGCIGVSSAWAMPNFARKYGMECSGCHTIIPRLNETGFNFRAAGFRTPDEIGREQTKPFELGDYTTARNQMRLNFTRDKSQAPGKTEVTRESAQIEYFEFTFYPLSGSYGRHWGSLSEFSFAADGVAEVENGYLRYNGGGERTFWGIRGGVFHPFEGYGASDRIVGLTRPLFQTQAANNGQSTLFTIWGLDQAGLEVAGHFSKTTAAAGILNGIFDDNGSAAPAQGGELVKPRGTPSHDRKDFQLFVNQILGAENGIGLSGYAYRGVVDLPRNDLTGGVWPNEFTRLAGYLYVPFMEKVAVQGGAEWGQDHMFDPATREHGATFKSNGFFGEAILQPAETFAASVRFDLFDPSTDRDNNKLQQIVVAGNVPLQNGVQLIAEYRHLIRQTGLTEGKNNPDSTTDALQFRGIFIF